MTAPPGPADGGAQVNAEASGYARVYQVNHGDMYVHTDETRSAAERIAAMPVRRAAQELTEMARGRAIAVLAQLSEIPAARRLAMMRPEVSAELLAAMDEQLASRRLAEIPSDQAAAILAGIPPDRAWHLLVELPHSHGRELFFKLSAERAAGLATRMPAETVRRVFAGATAEQAAAVLAKLPRSFETLTGSVPRRRRVDHRRRPGRPVGISIRAMLRSRVALCCTAAGLVVLISGIVLVDLDGDGDANRPVADRSPSSGTSTTASSPTKPAGTPLPAGQVSPGADASATFSLRLPRGVECISPSEAAWVDVEKRIVNDYTATVDLAYAADCKKGAGLFPAVGSLLGIPDSNQPGRSQCRARALSHPADQPATTAQLTVGSAWCLITRQRNVALLVVSDVTWIDRSDKLPVLTLAVTLWPTAP